MGESILITSGKGGVGKTTCCAVLGAMLSRLGRKVLLLDGDMGLRDLDLMLGVQDEVLFTSRDLWEKNCFREEAIISITDTLDFLPATQEYCWDSMKKKAFAKMIRRLKKSYDYILIDGPAGIGKSLEVMAPLMDQIVLVVEPSWLSIRDAQKVQSLLQSMNFRNYSFVVNKMHVDPEQRVLSFDEMEQALSVDSLVTVLPWTVEAQRLSNNGNIEELLENVLYQEMIEKAAPVLEGGYYEDWLEVEEAFNQHFKAHVLPSKGSNSTLTNMAKAMQRGAAWRWRRRRRF